MQSVQTYRFSCFVGTRNNAGKFFTIPVPLPSPIRRILVAGVGSKKDEKEKGNRISGVEKDNEIRNNTKKYGICRRPNWFAHHMSTRE